MSPKANTARKPGNTNLAGGETAMDAFNKQQDERDAQQAEFELQQDIRQSRVVAAADNGLR